MTPRHIALASLALVGCVALGLYGFGVLNTSPSGARVSAHKAGDGEPADLRDRLTALTIGEMRGWTLHETAGEASAKPFVDADDAEMTLADFHGQVVLLNFWATWCGPCIEEMPALNQLATEIEASPMVDEFTLLAVNLDPNLDRAEMFLAEADLDALDFYRDASTEFAFEMMAGEPQMPSTFLIDRDGGVVGRYVGAAEWDSAEGRALIEAAVEATRGENR